MQYCLVITQTAFRKTASVSRPLRQYGGGSERSQFPEHTRTQTCICLYICRGIFTWQEKQWNVCQQVPFEFLVTIVHTQTRRKDFSADIHSYLLHRLTPAWLLCWRWSPALCWRCWSCALSSCLFQVLVISPLHKHTQAISRHTPRWHVFHGISILKSLVKHHILTDKHHGLFF